MMSRILQEITACMTDDGDILNVLRFSDQPCAGNAAERLRTDRGYHVTRVGADEFFLTWTGQRMTAIRRGGEHAAA